jgi:hypothetical protein
MLQMQIIQDQYPANTDGTTNSSYWDLLVKGFDYQSGAYDACYNIQYR